MLLASAPQLLLQPLHLLRCPATQAHFGSREMALLANGTPRGCRLPCGAFEMLMVFGLQRLKL
jgi:hypothetical protein